MVIAAIPKSGSSLITSIFAHHGLWVGECLEKPEYPCYENRAISEWLRTKPDQRQPFGSLISQINPKGERWLYKCKPVHAVEIYRLTQCHLVKVKRNPLSVRKSRPLHEHHNIKPHEKALNKLDVPCIYSDEVMAGNLRSLKSAFKHCGMSLNPDIVDACIDPAMWHHR